MIGQFLGIHVHWNTDLWALSHSGTGLLLASSPDLEMLTKLAKELSVLDWNFTEVSGCPAATTRRGGAIIQEYQRVYPGVIIAKS